jgi:hypothetical protein
MVVGHDGEWAYGGTSNTHSRCVHYWPKDGCRCCPLIGQAKVATNHPSFGSMPAKATTAGYQVMAVQAQNFSR